MDAKHDDDPAARRVVAQAYRAQRTRELNEMAAKAVGRPVEVAAKFDVNGSRVMFKTEFFLFVPIVGWFLGLRHAYRMRGLRRIRMLALDAGHLYAVGPRGLGTRYGESGVIREWPRHEVGVLEMEQSGPDTLVTFTVSGGRELRFYCSSVRTNPWAAELLRGLGAEPPPAITATG